MQRVIRVYDSDRMDRRNVVRHSVAVFKCRPGVADYVHDISTSSSVKSSG